MSVLANWILGETSEVSDEEMCFILSDFLARLAVCLLFSRRLWRGIRLSLDRLVHRWASSGLPEVMIECR